MPVVTFLVFIAMVSICILILGYGLPSSETRPIGRRCRMSSVIYRRRRVRRQRVRCRFEG